MWKQSSLLRVVRSLAILVVLGAAVVVLQSKAGALRAPMPNCTLGGDGFWNCGTEQGDCIHNCDVQFYNPPPNPPNPQPSPYGCAGGCCVHQQNGSWDCSGCPDCQSAYVSCVGTCYGDGVIQGCINPSRCARQAGWAYKACILNAAAYGCLLGDGSVDQDCCDNAGGDNQVNCCYP